MISLDACMAVIGLHNQGYTLKAGEGNQVMIHPAVTEAQAAQIMAIRKGMKEARRAIQHLPQLCVVIMPGVLKEYAADLFSAMQEHEHVQIIAIRYHRGTGETEWAYVPMDETAHCWKVSVPVTGNWPGSCVNMGMLHTGTIRLLLAGRITRMYHWQACMLNAKGWKPCACMMRWNRPAGMPMGMRCPV